MSDIVQYDICLVGRREEGGKLTPGDAVPGFKPSSISKLSILRI